MVPLGNASIRDSAESGTERLGLPIAISGVLVVASFFFFWLWGHPVEDAAMLFTYSENIADGEGIVYNPGGERVDGASDLLLALLLAGLKLLGIPVQAGCALVNAASLGFIAFAIWTSWSMWSPRFRLSSPSALVVFLFTTPIFYFGTTGFGTLFFSALIAIVALIVVHIGPQPSWIHLSMLGVAITVAGMDRVEGFWLGGAIVFAYSVGLKSLRLLIVPMVVSVVLALCWFTWRWAYFGWPLPNPLYKKGGLNQVALRASIRYIGVFALPWYLLLAAGLITKGTRRLSLSLGLVVLGSWTALWGLVSNEMNLAGRFQFPVVPVLAIVVPNVLMHSASEWGFGGRLKKLCGGGQRLVKKSAVILLVMAVLGSTALVSRAQIAGLTRIRIASFHEEVADALQTATTGFGRIVTTEAGMIAWKTDLYVVDLWGLNNKQVTHQGLLRPNDIAGLSPDYLFSHPVSTKFLDRGVSGTQEGSWGRMNANLFCFAQANGFEPVAIWGIDEKDLWVMHARRDAPGLELLRQLLRGVKEGGSPPEAVTVDLPLVANC